MTQQMLVADVAGRVARIDAGAGDKIAQGDTVITLESMKMEMAVEAPAAGRIAKILVAEDDMVAEGQDLAVIELD